MTNTHVKCLEALKNLRELDVSFCYEITDEALETFARLPNLQKLDLSVCYNVANVAIDAFRRAHPQLLVLVHCFT